MNLTESDLLRMQGETIVAKLRSNGYQAQKLTTQETSWEITSQDENSNWYAVLIYLPRPVAQWRLLPHGYDAHRTKIYGLIETVLGGRK